MASKKSSDKMTEAEKEAEKLIKDAKQAEKKAKAAASKAEKEAEAAKKAKQAEALKKKTLKGLESDAKNINARFASIERAETRADDQRLAAALLIADAKKKAREAKINFKAWCEENLEFPPIKEGGEPRKVSFQTIRKLLPVGEKESEKEGEGLKMLEDMREANAERNRQHREKQRKEKEKNGDGDGRKGPDPDKLREKLADLEEEDWRRIMGTEARAHGFYLKKDDEAGHDDDTPDEIRGEGGEARTLSDAEKEAIGDASLKPLDRAKKAYGRLKGKSKLTFAKWVAEEIGMILTEPKGDD